MAQGVQEVLIVELAGQRLGLPAPLVRELLRAVAITPLPGSARLIEGVISIRGRVVPVFDLRQWLGLPARPLEPADHLVVLRTGDETAALRVDRALELARFEATPNKPVAYAFGSENPGSRSMGSPVVQHPGGLVVLPDMTAFLAQGRAALQGPNFVIPNLDAVAGAAP